MNKKTIMKAHEMAKANMKPFKKEYGADEGKDVAYATMMKMAKAKKLADGGNVLGGPLKEWKAERPNPYDGNPSSADDIERASKGEGFASGGKVPAGGLAEGGMADKKKSAVLAIVAKLAKKPMSGSMEMNGEEEGGEEGGPMEPMKVGEDAMHEAGLAAASEIMDAVKSGDKEALASALYNLMECYKAHEEQETPEEEASEHEE